MQKRTREILALVLLIVLGMGLALAAGWYLVAGHAWNVTATHIDDYVGEMDGYTVILYEGTLKHQGKRSNQETPDPVDLGDAAASYAEKDAAVLLLDSKRTERYRDPRIYRRGAKRLGVFSTEGRYRFGTVMRNVVYLQRHGVDAVVALSPDRALLKTASPGVDVAVFACDARVPDAGHLSGGVFCVDSPRRGEVQAVIISPSNVVSSRTVREV